MATPDNMKAEVVICGAGMAGVATAYYLAAQHSLTDVLLVDKLGPLTLTSDKSVEAYRNWWPDPVMVAFMNRSIDLIEGLARETDNAFGLNRRGYAYVTTDPARIEDFQHNVTHHAGLGLGPVRLHAGFSDETYQPQKVEGFEDQPTGADLFTGKQAIAAAFPYLNPATVAVLHARRCGWFSGQQLGMLMLERAKALGVRELRGEVTAVRQDGQGVSAVEVSTDSGLRVIHTRRFVNAAGPFLAEIGKLLNNDVPVQNILHQKIVFKDTAGVIPRDAPMVIDADGGPLNWTDEERVMWDSEPDYRWLLDDFPPGCHLRPEGAGDSNWLLLAWGLAHEAQNPVWQPSLSPEFPEVVLRGALRIAPELSRYVGRMPQPVMRDGGYYTRAAENLPIIGPMGVQGTFVVGGLSGYGMMAGCAAGQLAANWITGSTLPDYAGDFRLQRFDDAAYVASLAERGPSGEL